MILIDVERITSKGIEMRNIRLTGIVLIYFILCSLLSYEGVSNEILRNNEENYIATTFALVKKLNIPQRKIKFAISHKNSKLIEFAKTCNDTLKEIPLEKSFEHTAQKYMMHSIMHNPIGCIKDAVKEFSEAEKMYNEYIIESESIADSLGIELTDSLYFEYALGLVSRVKHLEITYNYLFRSLLLCEQYDIILEEIEKFKIIFLSARLLEPGITLSSDITYADNFNYYFALKAYCYDKIGEIDKSDMNLRETYLFFEHPYINSIFYSEVLARIFIEWELDYIEPKVFIDNFINHIYIVAGPEFMLRSHFLRKIHPDNYLNIIENELDAHFIRVNKKKNNAEREGYINNFERIFMHLAFLHYEKGNSSEAMHWFKRSLTEYSTFDGDWDYWLRYRYYEKGEKEALLKLKEQYLKEKGK